MIRIRKRKEIKFNTERHKDLRSFILWEDSSGTKIPVEKLHSNHIINIIKRYRKEGKFWYCEINDFSINTIINEQEYRKQNKI